MQFSDEVSKILDILKENPRGMSVTDIAAAIDLNRNTVSRYLDMLLVAGQVEMKTYGKAKVFFLSQRVPISAMLDYSMDIVIVLDQDMRIVQVNDAACAFTGAEKDRLLGAELRNSALVAFDHPVIRSKIREGIGGSVHTEEIVIRKAEEELTFRFKIIPAVFNDGSPGVTLVLEDFTAQRRSEEALRESENTFRALVEEINDIIWNIDENGEFAYVSPRVLDILGYEPGNLIGKPLSFFMETDEADRIRHSLATLPPNSRSLIEYRMKNSKGDVVVLEASVSPMYDAIGSHTGYHIVSRNVTERNAANERVSRWKEFLFSIVENIPARVMVKRADNGEYIFFNRSAEVFLGKSRDEMMQKTDRDLFGNEVSRILESMDRILLRTAGFVEEPEIEFDDWDRERMILRVRKIPLFISGGIPKYILIIGEDITGRKQAEQLLIAERDRAQSYLDVAGVMIAVVDAQGIIKEINQKGCRELGYERNELIGKDWFASLVPEAERKRLLQNFSAIMSGSGNLSERETGRLVKKGGEECTILWHNALLRDPKGTISAMVSSGNIITGREG